MRLGHRLHVKLIDSPNLQWFANGSGTAGAPAPR